MVEGFEQGTDRPFAKYLTYSKGSVAEILKRLRKAYYRRYITRHELDARVAQGQELEKMLGALSSTWKKATGRTAATTTLPSSESRDPML